MRSVILAGLLIFLCIHSVPAQEPVVQQQSTTAALTASGDFETGMALYRQRRYQQAITEFEKVVAADSTNAAAHYFMGYAHYMLDHHEEALSAFAKAFEADPSFDPRPYLGR